MTDGPILVRQKFPESPDPYPRLIAWRVTPGNIRDLARMLSGETDGITLCWPGLLGYADIGDYVVQGRDHHGYAGFDQGTLDLYFDTLEWVPL